MENIILELVELIRFLDVKKLKEELNNYHNSDIAKVLLYLNEDEKDKLRKALDKEDISDVVTYIDDQKEYLQNVPDNRIIDIVNNLNAKEISELLDNIEDSKKELIISKIEDKKIKNDLNLIRSYEDEQIGSKMISDFISIPYNYLVKDAMRVLLEKSQKCSNIITLFAVDENNYYKGTIELNELIIARKNDPLETIIHTYYPYLLASDNLADNLNKIQEYNLKIIPLLDDDHKLIGALRIEDVVELLDEKLSDDYAKLAGLNLSEDLNESLKSSLKKRLPWLFLLMGLGMIISIILSNYEKTIATISVVVFFQSLILDMAGNSATQSLAVTIRVLEDEKITSSKLLKMFIKEVKVGITNGLLLGFLSFIIVFLFLYLTKSEIIVNQGFKLTSCFQVSLIIAISLFASMSISTLIGSSIPMILKKIKIDPAVASGPFITTLNDILAIIVYYSLITIFLL